MRETRAESRARARGFVSPRTRALRLVPGDVRAERAPQRANQSRTARPRFLPRGRARRRPGTRRPGTRRPGTRRPGTRRPVDRAAPGEIPRRVSRFAQATTQHRALYPPTGRGRGWGGVRRDDFPSAQREERRGLGGGGREAHARGWFGVDPRSNREHGGGGRGGGGRCARVRCARVRRRGLDERREASRESIAEGGVDGFDDGEGVLDVGERPEASRESVSELVVRGARKSRHGDGADGAAPTARGFVRGVESSGGLVRYRDGLVVGGRGGDAEDDARLARLALEHVRLDVAPPSARAGHGAHGWGLGEPRARSEGREATEEVPTIAGTRLHAVAERGGRRARVRRVRVEVHQRVERLAESRGGIVRHRTGRPRGGRGDGGGGRGPLDDALGRSCALAKDV